MAQPSDLETRVTALEGQVRELTDRVRHTEHDAAAARVLAGGADRDVTELRAEIRDFREQNTRVLNALREDLTDLRSHVDERFAKVDDGFAEMRGKLDASAAGLQVITDMLATLVSQHGEESHGK
jgi:chromosome segregation ATPase